LNVTLIHYNDSTFARNRQQMLMVGKEATIN